MLETSQAPEPSGSVKVVPGRPVLLDCPKCSHFISSADIDLKSETACCSHCQHEFNFEEQLQLDPHRRPELIMPESIDSLKLGSMLEIVIDWYQAAPKKTVATLVTGSFLWNVLLLPFILYLAYSGQFYLMLLLGGHLVAGIALIIQLVATFLNKSTIKVSQEGINITHGPIKSPLNRNRFIKRDDIQQLFVVRYTHKYHKKANRGVQAYALFVIMKDGTRLELVRGMDRSSQLYIEQEIETYLNIRDEPIEGEVPRKD